MDSDTVKHVAQSFKKMVKQHLENSVGNALIALPVGLIKELT
jgi:hypothetical protein